MTEIIALKLFKSELLGGIGISVSGHGLLRLRMFQDDQDSFLKLNQAYGEGEYRYSDLDTGEAERQITAYLAGELRLFTLPIDWRGYTEFQRAVLKETLAIPYGQTKSYGEVAAAIGKPKASRAVGQAEKSNDVPLVIPCHRVIGSDGSLTGYGGKDNTDIKAKLLNFEQLRR